MAFKQVVDSCDQHQLGTYLFLKKISDLLLLCSLAGKIDTGHQKWKYQRQFKIDKQTSKLWFSTGAIYRVTLDYVYVTRARQIFSSCFRIFSSKGFRKCRNFRNKCKKDSSRSILICHQKTIVAKLQQFVEFNKNLLSCHLLRYHKDEKVYYHFVIRLDEESRQSNCTPSMQANNSLLSETHLQVNFRTFDYIDKSVVASSLGEFAFECSKISYTRQAFWYSIFKLFSFQFSIICRTIRC